MTRDQMAKLFHSMYLENIRKATLAHGKMGAIRMDGEEIKQIFNETVADFGQRIKAESWEEYARETSKVARSL